MDKQTLDSIVSYKANLSDQINCTLTSDNRINKILKLIGTKENLNNEEIQKIKSTLAYLKSLTDNQMHGEKIAGKFDDEFDNIIKHLSEQKLNSSDLNQITTKLKELQSAILNYRKEFNIQDKIRLITESIEKHGEILEGIKLNRVDHLQENMLGTIALDGESLSVLMSKAMTDKDIKTKVCNYLNTEQPTIIKDSFMSTSLSPTKAWDGNKRPVHWTLIPDKNVKGLYIEDLYEICGSMQNHAGREAEVLVQRGSKIQIKKAELKDGIWELEGVITPSEA
jgi:hypothetical protein